MSNGQDQNQVQVIFSCKWVCKLDIHSQFAPSKVIGVTALYSQAKVIRVTALCAVSFPAGLLGCSLK